MILDEIVDATIIRIEKARKNLSLNEMMALAKNSEPPFAFENALKQEDISFICEVKKASPSKGIITNDFPYIKIAKEYEKAGAAAISVLTEPDFFMGSINYLKEIKQNITIPILQKDFIIDEYQIYEASMAGADAILLICTILSITKVKKFIKIADSLGLSCLVEAHDEQEVKKAVEAGARVIGVNNRNLKTFEVDINNSIHLRRLVPENIIFVSESGIQTRDDINALRVIGTDAVLIGETFMRSKNIKAELDILRGKCCD
ncbi:MAG: indole-3-glycerol phosphate synthase TrpC [Candidatus Humimicrobiaceae bacterium]